MRNIFPWLTSDHNVSDGTAEIEKHMANPNFAHHEDLSSRPASTNPGHHTYVACFEEAFDSMHIIRSHYNRASSIRPIKKPCFLQ